MICIKWFTSDWHLYSNFVLTYDKRPFSDIKQMSDAIINNTNKCVKPGDILYILGDFCDFKPDETEPHWEIAFTRVRDINCDVVLILGNNEYRLLGYQFNGHFPEFENYILSQGVKAVHNCCSIGINGLAVHLNHFPVGADKEIFNLFGHTHKFGGIYAPHGINVGIDLHNYYPVSEEEVREYYLRHIDAWCKDVDLISKFK